MCTGKAIGIARRYRDGHCTWNIERETQRRWKPYQICACVRWQEKSNRQEWYRKGYPNVLEWVRWRLTAALPYDDKEAWGAFLCAECARELGVLW